MLTQPAGRFKPIWAYAYHIEPPQPEQRLARVRELLELEGLEARAEGRIWHGRILRERTVAQIFVVADSPDQSLDVNERVATALRKLGVVITITVPLAVSG